MIYDVPVAKTAADVYMRRLLGNVHEALPLPTNKVEVFLYLLCGGAYNAPQPITSEERFLAYLLGVSGVTLPTPQTRLETYMDKVCRRGSNAVVPPKTRYELYWWLWAGVTEITSSAFPLVFQTSLPYLRNYQIYGNTNTTRPNAIDNTLWEIGQWCDLFGVKQALPFGATNKTMLVGDVITVNWQSPPAAFVVSFYDSTGAFISREAPINPITPFLIIPPTDAVHFIPQIRCDTNDTITQDYIDDVGVVLTTALITPDSTANYSFVGEKTVNLFDVNDALIEKNRYLDANGNIKTTVGWNVSGFIEIIPLKEYTFAPNSSGGDSAKHCFFDENKNFIKAIKSGKQSFTTPSNAKYVRFSYRDNSYDIMLNFGTTAPDHYIPYGYEADVTVSGENLLDMAISNWEQGTIMTGGHREPSTTRIRTKGKQSISPNTDYTVSAYGEIVPAFHLWNGDKYVEDSGWITAGPKTFNRNANLIEFVARGIANETFTPQKLDGTRSIQFNLSPLSPVYIGDEPLRKIGDYADYVDYEKQRVVRMIGTLDLGSIEWEKTTDSNFLSRFQITNMRVIGNSGVNNALCSAYPEVPANKFADFNSCFSSCLNESPTLYFKDIDKKALTVEEFQASMTGIKLYYTLAEATFEPLTLPQIPTQDGTNTLTVETTVEPSKVVIEA